MLYQSEFDFILPKGYVDEDGNLHRNGVMRLATAADEILPLKDPRVQQNPAYLPVILLSRVIVKLGTLRTVSTKVIEGLFASDLAYLMEFYSRINQIDGREISVTCPNCHHEFKVKTAAIADPLVGGNGPLTRQTQAKDRLTDTK